MGVFRIVANIVSYLIYGFLMYACLDINKQLIYSAETNNSLEMLGFGLSKIILIPILAFLYLILVVCIWTTFVGAIRMLSRRTKIEKVFGIFFLILNLFMIGFTTYLIVQFCKVVI